MRLGSKKINSLASILGFVISAVIMILVYRIVFNNLGLEGIGVWSIALAFTSVSGIGSSTFGGSVVKYVSKYLALDQPKKIVSLIHTSFVSIFILVMILSLIIYSCICLFGHEVFESDEFSLIKDILPFVMLGFMCSNLAYVFQASLEGLQQYLKKNINQIFSKFLYLILVIILLPKYGILGLGYAYVAQFVILLFISLFSLKSCLSYYSFISLKFDYSMFKEILNYGFKFQLSAIGMMFLDPSVKLLIRYFGGIEDVGIYELASKLMEMIKGMFASILNIFVPVFSTFQELNKSQMQPLFINMTRLSFGFAVTSFSVVILLLPAISIFWLGKLELNFVSFSSMIGLSIISSTIATPSWYCNLGKGTIELNLYSILVYGLLNILIGIILGLVLGASGVVLSFVISGIIANCFLLSLTVGELHLEVFQNVFSFCSLILFIIPISCVFLINVLITEISYSKVLVCSISLAISTSIPLFILFMKLYFESSKAVFKD